MRSADSRQQWAPHDTNHGKVPAQVLALSAPSGREVEAPTRIDASKRVPGRQVISKNKILNWKENQTKN